MSRIDLLLWIVLPYVALTVFVVGHVWRYRADQFGWTTRSTQLLESRRLRPAVLAFHFGLLAVLGGALGAVLAQRSLGHKTRKQPFATILLAICATQVIVAGWVIASRLC